MWRGVWLWCGRDPGFRTGIAFSLNGSERVIEMRPSGLRARSLPYLTMQAIFDNLTCGYLIFMNSYSLPKRVRDSYLPFRSLVIPSLLLFFLCCSGAYAAGVEGKIVDAETKEPLVAANVLIESVRRITRSDDEGTYRISNLQPGEYRLEFSSLGYLPDTILITITNPEQTISLDVALDLDLSNPNSVVVQARRSQESDATARQIEQNSPTVVNVLSGETMERSTDVTTAEALQRVPGVSTTRVRGEARDATIRGMEARYNNTTVDGVQIPSPNTNTRVVSADFLASDLLQRIEVTKVLTPNMEGDAIGGSVNVVTREAPSEPVLRVRVGTGYSSMFLNHDYLGFRTDSITADPLERFGRGYRVTPGDFPRDNVYLQSSTALPDFMGEITLGRRVLDGKLGIILGGSVQQKYQFSEVARNYAALDLDNNVYFTHREYRVHSHSKTNSGLNLKADYKLGEKSSVAASVVAFFRRNRETRFLSDTNFTFTPILYTKERTVYQQHNIITSSVSGKHQLGAFQLKWRGGWAYADQNKPDRAEVVTTNQMIGDVIVPDEYFQYVDRDWQHNSDNDWEGSLDLAWEPGWNSGFKLSTGVLGRLKERNNYVNAYRLIPIPDPVNGRIPLYPGLQNVEWEVANVAGTPEYSNNNYEAEEDLLAAYTMGEIHQGKWHLLGGIRVEGVQAEYSTYDVNLLGQKTASKSYADILPSAHLRYALNEASNLRLSIGRSVSRPNYFDLIPYNYITGEVRQQGNPALKRSIATNLDLRYELFPTIEQKRQFAVGLFAKWIDDPVETTLDLSNPSLPTFIPKNVDMATSYGAEVTASIDLFPSLALLGNYTYTHSAITSEKFLFNKELGITEQHKETHSLQGQSDHVANLSALFSDTGMGTTAQLSFVFTGERVVRITPFYGLNHVQTDFPMLDFSATQKLWKNLSLFLQVTNLLNSPYELRLENGLLIEKELFGRHAEIGFSYKY